MRTRKRKRITLAAGRTPITAPSLHRRRFARLRWCIPVASVSANANTRITAQDRNPNRLRLPPVPVFTRNRRNRVDPKVSRRGSCLRTTTSEHGDLVRTTTSEPHKLNRMGLVLSLFARLDLASTATQLKYECYLLDQKINVQEGRLKRKLTKVDIAAQQNNVRLVKQHSKDAAIT